MKLELQHRWADTKQLKFIKPVHRIWRRYKACIPILSYFIDDPTIIDDILLECKGCAIMPLVDVLEQVLDCLDARACFHINVAVVSHKQKRVVRDHPSIVQICSSDFNSTPIIPPSIDGI
jgi:hypothetical protein